MTKLKQWKKTINRWWQRQLHPVQVGDIWEQKGINPFAERIQFKIVEYRQGWVKCQNLSTGNVYERNEGWVEFYSHLVEAAEK